MNSPFFRIESLGNSRYDLIFRVNLKMIAKILLALVALALVAFVGYWLVQGAIWAGGAAWTGLCWLASQWMWILGILLLALLVWGLSKVNWKSVKAPKVSPKLLWLLAAILLLLLCFLAFRSCGDEDGKAQPEDVVVIDNDSEPMFTESFDDVIITRAYLDGVQNADDEVARALVGLKYVDGKPVKSSDFAGKTYEEAKKVVAKDWYGFVQETLDGVKISKQRLVPFTSLAMRNGKYGFVKSDFLKAVKAGEPNAEEKMALHKANGEKRELGIEAKQYLWVLKNMWKGNITAEMLLDLPMFSYKNIPLNEMYNEKGEAQWNDALLNKLRQHSGQTPREALGL